MPIAIVGHKREPNTIFFCSNKIVKKSLQDDLKTRYGYPSASFDLNTNNLTFDEGGSILSQQDWHEIALKCNTVFRFMPHQYNALFFKLSAAIKVDSDYIVLESWYQSLCIERSEGKYIMRVLLGLQNELEEQTIEYFEIRKHLARLLKEDSNNNFIMAEHLTQKNETIH